MVWISDCNHNHSYVVVYCNLSDDQGEIIPLTPEFAAEFMPIRDALQYGLAFDPSAAPKTYRLTAKRKLRDVFLIQGGLMVVSGTMKDLLEQHNLGKTQFFEIEIRDHKNVPTEERFFLIHVLEKKNSIRADLSDVEVQGHRVLGDDACWHASLFPGKIVLDQNKVGGADLWLESRLAKGLFFSDRLAEAVTAAKIKPLKLTEVELT